MVSPTTEEGAYTYLRITDRGINDSDVVASSYALYSKLPEAAKRPSSIFLTYTGALRTIAVHRQSRLLAFVLSILPHLNDHNVGLLTYTPLPPMPKKAAVRLQTQDTLPVGIGHIILTEPDTTVRDAANGTSQHGGHTSNEKEDQTMTPASSGLEENESTSSYCDSPSPIAESASSADIPSSSVDLMDTSSDSSGNSSREEGKYYDGQRWRCEECSERLAVCQCPDGCSTYRCALCGSGEADMEFCTYCSRCHNTNKGSCGGCRDVANIDCEEEEDLSTLLWDADDKIWRCALCHGEVEANSDEEGHCHCYTKHDIPVYIGLVGLVPGYSWSRRIELSEYPEYQPADSDSSGADPTDSEPDSGDEEFIEDDGPFTPGLLNLLAGNYDPFENTSVCAPQPMDTEADHETDVQDDAPSQPGGPSLQA
ncbi:MAG: hypothetical protein Q9226_006196 [Calogaya cf. arnoldii]